MRRNTIKKCEVGVGYMLEYGWSINYSAKNANISKSSLHRYIHNELPYQDDEKYGCVKNIIKKWNTRW